MSVMSFIALLPAVLAAVVFLAYRLLTAQQRSDGITKAIVDKLSAEVPQTASSLKGLTARQVSQRLEQDHKLQLLVGEGNMSLLQQVVRQEFARSVIIYSLVLVLFIVGIAAFVYLQTRPQPSTLSNISIQDIHPDADGLLVDLDDLLVTWQAEGRTEDYTFVLENIQTGKRSQEMRAASHEQKIIFTHESYRSILEVREKGEVNRIRVVARGSNNSFNSKSFDLNVGIQIMVLHWDDKKEIWISAMIDESSISYYSFEGDLLVYPKDESSKVELYEGEFKNNPYSIVIFHNYDDLDWRTTKFLYSSPDDPRLVRQMPMRN